MRNWAALEMTARDGYLDTGTGDGPGVSAKLHGPRSQSVASVWTEAPKRIQTAGKYKTQTQTTGVETSAVAMKIEKMTADADALTSLHSCQEGNEAVAKQQTSRSSSS
jgi:hypothetical protein